MRWENRSTLRETFQSSVQNLKPQPTCDAESIASSLLANGVAMLFFEHVCFFVLNKVQLENHVMRCEFCLVQILYLLSKQSTGKHSVWKLHQVSILLYLKSPTSSQKACKCKWYLKFGSVVSLLKKYSESSILQHWGQYFELTIYAFEVQDVYTKKIHWKIFAGQKKKNWISAANSRFHTRDGKPVWDANRRFFADDFFRRDGKLVLNSRSRQGTGRKLRNSRGKETETREREANYG